MKYKSDEVMRILGEHVFPFGVREELDTQYVEVYKTVKNATDKIFFNMGVWIYLC